MLWRVVQEFQLGDLVDVQMVAEGLINRNSRVVAETGSFAPNRPLPTVDRKPSRGDDFDRFAAAELGNRSRLLFRLAGAARPTAT